MLFDKTADHFSRQEHSHLLTEANATLQDFEEQNSLTDGANNCRQADEIPKIVGPWGVIHNQLGVLLAAAGDWKILFGQEEIDLTEPFGSHFDRVHGRAYEKAVDFLIANPTVNQMNLTLGGDLDAVLLPFESEDGSRFVVSRIAYTNLLNIFRDDLESLSKAA